ncbi:MAG TPA: hypothetical protein VMV23_05420 [Candidatus Nanopelagicaceae bacterium]|nr:hypothetical protein [Candidatus Nanopelagicaceae bacterium]
MQFIRPMVQLSTPRHTPARTEEQQGELLAEAGLLFGLFGLLIGLASRQGEAVTITKGVSTLAYTPPAGSNTCTGCQSC